MAGQQQAPPKDYPEAFFARAKLQSGFINSIIGRLRMDDIYNQIVAWPIPEHRSTALATQAAMIYVLLFFVPEVLASERAIMREVVDKHFADNWIISMYLGYTVDLSVAWSKFPAAMKVNKKKEKKKQLTNILKQRPLNRRWKRTML
jgi:WASH complex subunit strumpellin